MGLVAMGCRWVVLVAVKGCATTVGAEFRSVRPGSSRTEKAREEKRSMGEEKS